MTSEVKKLSINRENSNNPEMQECGVCCESLPPERFLFLQNCGHSYCDICITKHITYSIRDSRIDIPCPGCNVFIHSNEIYKYCHNMPELLAKYEEFALRGALIKLKNIRWCPTPDCGYAVIVPHGSKCPKIKCEKCNSDFCFDCKKPWHPKKTCRNSEEVKWKVGADLHLRPCPRCRTVIEKEDDGSCNHMVCTMCRANFCWLCLREINDFHFMSPTGCTFWGKKQWSKKKKLAVQIGALFGSPLVIAATAIVSVPLIVGIFPFQIGKIVYRKMKKQSKPKRVITAAAAFTGTLIVSPVVATCAVAIGTPVAIGYIYVMVPKALIHDGMEYIRKRRGTSESSEDVVDIVFVDKEPPKSYRRRRKVFSISDNFSVSEDDEDVNPEDVNSDGTKPGTSEDVRLVIDEGGQIQNVYGGRRLAEHKKAMARLMNSDEGPVEWDSGAPRALRLIISSNSEGDERLEHLEHVSEYGALEELLKSSESGANEHLSNFQRAGATRASTESLKSSEEPALTSS